MLDSNWMITKRLKGLILLLLLTGFVQVAQAQQESATIPLVIESIPDSTPVADSTPSTTATTSATESTPAPASESTGPSALSEALTKAQTFLTESKSMPEGVKNFLATHDKEVQWAKDHPIHINAYALVLALLVRMCCGDKPVTKLPKPRPPQTQAPKPAPQSKKPKQITAVVAPAITPAPKSPEPEAEPANPFRKVLDETVKSPASSARDMVIAQTFLRWAAAEPKTSYQWALDLADRALGRRLLTEALIAEEDMNQQAALDLALITLPADLQDEIVDAIIRQWTRKQPQSAAAKIASLPENTPVLQTAVAALIETWADMDIEAAHHWLVALPVNLFRDLAISVFIQRLMVSSPESAAAWVESIANAEIRQQIIGLVAEKWQAVDPEAANAWVEKTSV